MVGHARLRVARRVGCVASLLLRLQVERKDAMPRDEDGKMGIVTTPTPATPASVYATPLVGGRSMATSPGAAMAALTGAPHQSPQSPNPPVKDPRVLDHEAALRVLRITLDPNDTKVPTTQFCY